MTFQLVTTNEDGFLPSVIKTEQNDSVHPSNEKKVISIDAIKKAALYQKAKERAQIAANLLDW